MEIAKKMYTCQLQRGHVHVPQSLKDGDAKLSISPKCKMSETFYHVCVYIWHYVGDVEDTIKINHSQTGNCFV